MIEDLERIVSEQEVIIKMMKWSMVHLERKVSLLQEKINQLEKTI